jgi:outer membrane receptor for ferrienterochelin and colicins
MTIARKILLLCLAAGLAGFFAHAAEDDQQRRRLGARHGAEGPLSVRGTVIDADRQPLAGAVVLIPPFPKSVETRADGVFEISGIPPGRYQVEVYAPGHMDFRSELFELSADIDEFEAVLPRIPAEEIVVTATRTPRLYAEVPVKTQIIGAREIEIRQATQLAESLAYTTGLRVETNCLNCNFTQVRINGMEGKYTQILIDNSPVFGSMVGVYGLEQIPAEMINRIEVVKGGGSALYGGNAVAGVINVLTKEPHENGASLSFQQEAIDGRPFSNFGFHSSLVSPSGTTKGFLFANARNRSPVDVNGDGFSEIGKLKATSFGFNLYQDAPGVRGKLKLGVTRIVENRRGGNAFDLLPHQADIAEAVESNMTGLSLEWNQYLSARMFYNVGFSYLDAARESYYGSGQDLNAYGSTRNPLLIFSGQFNRQSRGHLLSFGVQAKSERLEDRALGYGRVIDDTYSEIGVYIQDDMRISRTLSLLAGLRATQHSLIERLILNPRFSFLANLTPDIGWRTTLSTGFRAPQVFDEDLHITQVGGQGVVIRNAPDLKEEKSLSLSSGFDFGRQVGTHLLQVSAEGFFTVLRDAFVMEQQDSDTRENVLAFERINSPGARVAGVSLEFGLLSGSGWRINTGWTFQRSRLDEPEPDFGSQQFFRTPDVYGFLQFALENNKLADLELSLDYTGPMSVPHFAGYIEEDRLETVEDFWVLNARFSRELKFSDGFSAKIFAGVFNLLNAFQPDLDRGPDRDAGYIYGPSKPRSFTAGFTFNF